MTNSLISQSLQFYWELLFVILWMRRRSYCRVAIVVK